MATLILDRSNLEIRLDGAALAIYQAGEKQRSIPIKMIDRMVLQGRTLIDTNCITALTEQGVGLLLLSKRYSRRLALILGPQHNDAGVRLAQARYVTDSDWCNGWAWRQVNAKTRAQLQLLRRAIEARPDCRKPLTDATRRLVAIEQRLALLRSHPEQALLRGMEGAAARSYYQGYAALFPASLAFNGRNRRPPRDPVNACLSLGYTLLHFDAVRAAHSAGLDPLLGFYHRPAFGRESLASDLIEPLRPRLDSWVWNLFRSRQLREEHFSTHNGACLLGKSGRARFYGGFENQSGPGRRYLRRQCRILAKHLCAAGETAIAGLDGDEIDFPDAEVE